MTSRTVTLGMIALTAAGLLIGPAAAQNPFSSHPSCLDNDTACRLDGLERRLDYLIDLLERRSDGPGRPIQTRSVEMPVERLCPPTTDGCSVLAAQLCARGGFPRGVPAQTTQASWGHTLNRATCMD